MHMGLGYGMFVANMDFQKFREFAEQNEEEWDYWVKGKKLFAQYREEGKLKAVRGSCLMNEYANGRCWILHPYYPLPKGEHPWMVESMTRGEIDMRRQAWETFTMFKESVPGFENARLEQTPSRLLMRDSHRIVADHSVSVDDLYETRTFGDAIACCNMQVDVFFPTGSHHFKYENTPFDIPYSCMISKDIPNLMAAGGTVDCDVMSWSALRYCTPALCTGQAAGTAAAIAMKEGKTPKEIDVAHLQRSLNNQGMITSNAQMSPAAAEEYKLRARTWGSGLKL
jgi:hypothetical protein